MRQRAVKRGNETRGNRAHMIVDDRLDDRARLGVEPPQHRTETRNGCGEFQNGDGECLEDCFRRGRAGSRSTLRFIEQGQPMLVERANAPGKDGPDKGLLRLEMVIDGSEIDTGRARNFPEGCTVNTLMSKELLSGVEDSIPSRLTSGRFDGTALACFIHTFV